MKEITIAAKYTKHWSLVLLSYTCLLLVFSSKLRMTSCYFTVRYCIRVWESQLGDLLPLFEGLLCTSLWRSFSSALICLGKSYPFCTVHLCSSTFRISYFVVNFLGEESGMNCIIVIPTCLIYISPYLRTFT